jgi:hypothetical protein
VALSLWASVNGRNGFPLLSDVNASTMSEGGVLIKAAQANDVKVFYETNLVSIARSLVDSGYLVVTGPIISVAQSKVDRSIRYQSGRYPCGVF